MNDALRPEHGEAKCCSVADLLAMVRMAGLTLTVAGDRLVVRGSRGAEGLARVVLERKAEVLRAIQSPSVPVSGEADRILANLRADLKRIRRSLPGGKFSAAVIRLVADGVFLCKRHARGHAKLTAAGWDAMEYLRGQATLTLALARRTRKSPEEG